MNRKAHSLIHLASNENPFGPSPKAVAAMHDALSQAHFYPDDDASQLKKQLAEHHSIHPEQVLVGAGTTDLIGIIAHTLLGPGLQAITGQRTFIVYTLATRASGGELVKIPMREDGFDLDSLTAAINPSTRVVFLANPNNPTGTVVDAKATDKFLSRSPENLIVVLDEAYYQYAEYFAGERGVHYSHSLDYVREDRNVVVLRTFSKVHGMASMRIGYALGPPGLLKQIREMRSTYSISGPAQAGAIAALEDDAHIHHALEKNAEGADQLIQGLSNLGYSPVPTWANFVYCDVRKNADDFSAAMEREGVLIRSLGAWGAPTGIRITVGSREQNEAVPGGIQESFARRRIEIIFQFLATNYCI